MNNGITAAGLEKLDISEYKIIDIRDSSAFEYGHIDGAVNIAQEEILSAELPQDKKLIICCRSGIISADIADKLCEKGFEALPQQGCTAQHFRSHGEQSPRPALKGKLYR